jgi:hypothetical protein
LGSKKAPTWKEIQIQLKSPDAFIKTIGDFNVAHSPAAHFRKVRQQYLT